MPAQQRTITSREQQEERILRFSFLCSTFFTITEVAMAVVFHSYSILMDGIFDIADLILLGPFLTSRSQRSIHMDIHSLNRSF